MAEEIKNNLVFLKESLTNLPSVLLHCVQHKIISLDDKQKIMDGETSFDKADRFFDALIKKDWDEIKIKIVKIFRETSNKHCADKIETSVINNQSSISLGGLQNIEGRPAKGILSSKWWPVEKHLPKAFLERKEYDNELINILKDYLVISKNRSTVINQGTAVSGMGGVGKTTMANWFANRFQNCYDYIIWIDSGEENLFASFKDLAKELKIDATNLRHNLLAKKCFSKLEVAKCLFIFDNAECYQGHQGIRDFLPNHENFHTIITSRSTEWGSETGDGQIPQMYLTAFTTSDSVEFLRNNLNNLHTQHQLEELSDLLGNLPLALQIAVATVNKKKMLLTDYIERIKQTKHIINTNFDDYEKTINKTMNISLDIIKNSEEDPKQIAHKCLLVLGYVKPDLIPVHLLRSVENLSDLETDDALDLLEKYSLITTVRGFSKLRGRYIKSCSIHRLLQQVIRHNDKENAKFTLTKILNVEEFLEYKLLPYLYADDETKSQFSKLRAHLVDQNELEELIEQRRFDEALKLSRMIKKSVRTRTAKYNYAVCLEKVNKLTKAESVLQSLLLSGKSEKAERKGKRKQSPQAKLYHNRKPISRKERESKIGKNGIGNLEERIESCIVRGLLFVIYNRLGKEDAAYEIINQHSKLETYGTKESLDYVMKFLKFLPINGYQLKIINKFLSLKIGNDHEKIISLEECSLTEDFPRDLDELTLENVEMLNEEGLPLMIFIITPSTLNNLKILKITGDGLTQFAIQINDNLPNCQSITLENCRLIFQKGKRITPNDVDLRRISVSQTEEVENFTLNDLIDFRQTQTLKLSGNNIPMKLNESASMDKIFLHSFNGLYLKDWNGKVSFLSIEDTDLPLLDKNIALRVNSLHLRNCNVHLTTLFYLSQCTNKMILECTTVKTDETSIDKKFGTPELQLEDLKHIHDAGEMDEFVVNRILDFTRIKTLKVSGMRDTMMTLDLNQQFSIDCLELNEVKLRNWDKSTSTVGNINMRRVEVRDILKSQLRITDALTISECIIDITSFWNIISSAHKTYIRHSSIHYTDSNKMPKYDQTYSKEIEFSHNTIIKDGEQVESVLFNQLLNVSLLKDLCLKNSKMDIENDVEMKSSCITLDMENVSLSLDQLQLFYSPVFNWDKGKGNVDNLYLIGIPFTKKNGITINYLKFADCAVDVTCLPQNIQRLEQSHNSSLICNGHVVLNELKCLILHNKLSTLEYFSLCPNLTHVELVCFTNSESILNLDWMPKSIKILKLHRQLRAPNFNINKSTKRDPLKLETLIFEGLHISVVENALELLSPENVVIDIPTILPSNFKPPNIVELIKMYNLVAIGPFKWKNDEQFQNWPLSNVVDEKGQFYIFESQKGRLIQKSEFKIMSQL